MYKYYQPNKKDIKDELADCVIRALCKVADKTWVEIFNELIPYCIKLQSVPNDKPVYTAWLKDNGFVYGKISNKKGSKRPTVKNFKNEGKTILIVASHIVAKVDNHYYDTWDSGHCCLYGYWRKEE